MLSTLNTAIKKEPSILMGLVSGAAIAYAGYKFGCYVGENDLFTKLPSIDYPFTTESNGGELVAKVLNEQGVKFVFTLIGGHISPILIGCEKENIKVIDVRHESTTVFAADGVYRLTGVPGVAAVTAGPGLTNTITALKNAQLAQSAVILIGGATSDLLKGRGSLQDIDQFALVKPHVKWCSHISKVSDIVPTLEKAFKIAVEGTPGPVFIEFPIDTLYPQPITSSWYQKNKFQNQTLYTRIANAYTSYHLNRIFSALNTTIHIHTKRSLLHKTPSQSHVNTLIKKLKQAKRPVLVVGSQVTQLNDLYSIETLQRAIQNLEIPVFTSSMSRGLLGSSHPNLFRHCRSYALKNADLVILAGVTCDFRLGYGKSINSKAIVFGINKDSVDLYKNRSPTYAYDYDPGTFLVNLYSNIQSSKLPENWKEWADDLTGKDIQRNIEISNLARTPSKQGFMNPLRALQMFDESLPHKTIMVADGGDFVGTAAYIVRPRGPLSWLDPGVFGTLGCGAGFALAAKLVHPDHQVWCIFGDGAFGYSIPEYDTFVRHKLAIGAIIGNDACWMQIMRDQKDFLGSEVACNLAYTDYEQVVKAFGGEGFKATNETELKSALDSSELILQENVKPVVINCIIDRTDFRKGSISV
ncbi:hypothetical protein CYY_007423 [Polysphondylium violaceum]|uniref:IlvB-like protein n=1 Tax=Polysphondylium violaceum TaxID=133409 RepID=A0A8J4UXQ9_9MYCE|nr:hypothetical protein CYY_007423 [Polysphondylium violaceum]